MKEYLTPAEVARKLGINRGSVYNWLYVPSAPTPIRINGRLLFKAEDIERWQHRHDKVQRWLPGERRIV